MKPYPYFAFESLALQDYNQKASDDEPEAYWWMNEKRGPGFIRKDHTRMLIKDDSFIRKNQQCYMHVRSTLYNNIQFGGYFSIIKSPKFNGCL